MSDSIHPGRQIYKVVLTGGPCGGKTTGQDRLATFFESIGWRVYRIPETATILLKGGVRFAELTFEQSNRFQEDLLMTLMTIESVFTNLAESSDCNTLLIYDRGTMDASAFISPTEWEKILQRKGLNPIDLRDNRYHQVVHMVTAADGAEEFYTLANNATRTEGLEDARKRDVMAREAWIGHPYVDYIDNNKKSFDEKILKMVQVVCDRAGIDYGDRLAPGSKKRKFLVKEIIEAKFPKYQVFDVIHDYLKSSDKPDCQARIRRRGQGGKFSYTHTIRRTVNGNRVETRMQISEREYRALRALKNPNNATIHKKRRCFTDDNQYYQMDIYVPPSPPRCLGLIMLETYTTKSGSELKLPDCVVVEREITDEPEYSMATLSYGERNLQKPSSS